MKVTFVSWNYPSGSRHFAKAEVDALHKRKLLYRLITRDFKVYDGDLRLLKHYRVLLKLLLLLTSIIRRVFQPNLSKKFYHEWLFDLFSSIHIGRPDVLYLDKTNFPKVMKAAQRHSIATIAFQAMAHNDIIQDILKPECSKYQIHSSLFDRKLYGRRKLGIEIADKLIAHSRVVKESDLKMGVDPSKIKIAYGCVDSDVYVPNQDKKEREFTVMFVGNEPLKKGLFYLLAAWRRLGEIKAKLQIVGKVPEKIANDYKEIGSIDFYGSIPSNEVGMLYKKASIFVLPALIDAGPKVVLEAMASGLPVIVTDAIGYSEIIENGKEGFIVPIKDPKAIAEKIYFFYHHPEDTRIMGMKARKVAEKYSPSYHGSEIISHILELYKK